MINLMLYYIQIKYQPNQICNIILSIQQKVFNVTGPDAFSRAIYHSISINKQVLHRHIDYKKYFIRAGVSNYKNMYKLNGVKHYSEYRESLYI